MARIYANPKKLIRAVWAYANEDDAPLPRELRLAFHVPKYGPYWLAMPAGDDNRINAAHNVYTAITGYKKAKKKVEWIRDNPELYKIYRRAQEMVTDGN